MAQLLSVLLALSPSLLVDGRDVLGLGEVKHVMAGEEYNLRQQLSQVSILHVTRYIRGQSNNPSLCMGCEMNASINKTNVSVDETNSSVDVKIRMHSNASETKIRA